MSPTDSQTGRNAPAPKDQAPPSVKLGVAAAIVAMLAGAVYLIAVRGEALLIDLSTFASRVLCF